MGDDFREGKVTLPVIFAYARSNPEEKSFWKRTLEAQEMQDGDLEKSINIIHKYQAIEASIALAESYCESARRQLARFPASAEKAALLETIDFCIQRAY